MSSLTNNNPFSLDAINLRKKLVFSDGSIQNSAPGYIESLTSSASVSLVSGVGSLIFSTSALPVGLYSVSGFVQNEAVVGLGTTANIQYSATIFNNDGNFYHVGFTSIASQLTGQNPQPFLPITGTFRNTVANSVFEIEQTCIFTAGGYTQTDAYVEICYLGSQ